MKLYFLSLPPNIIFLKILYRYYNKNSIIQSKIHFGEESKVKPRLNFPARIHSPDHFLRANAHDLALKKTKSFVLVPEAGLEPARSLKNHSILSAARLPVPPPGQKFLPKNSITLANRLQSRILFYYEPCCLFSTTWLTRKSTTFWVLRRLRT